MALNECCAARSQSWTGQSCRLSDLLSAAEPDAGLDNAILGYLNADERKVDVKRIAQLLAHGAYALQAPDEDAAKEGEAFAQEAS